MSFLFFLQRIVNGGGRVEREYALGRKRTDLLVTWFYGEKKRQIVVIELKIKRGSADEVKKLTAKQTLEYMDKCGTKEGYIVIFDRKPGLSWEEKIYTDTAMYDGKELSVWCM